jgi:hypothetical protein
MSVPLPDTELCRNNVAMRPLLHTVLMKYDNLSFSVLQHLWLQKFTKPLNVVTHEQPSPLTLFVNVVIYGALEIFFFFYEFPSQQGAWQVRCVLLRNAT